MSAWVYFLGNHMPLEIGVTYIIGRGTGCDIQLPDISVSRRHAQLWSEDDEYFIEDLGSTNGTYVNGELVSRRKLRGGDKVRVGRLHVEFQIRDDESGSETLAPSDTVVLEGEIAELVRQVNDPDVAKRIAGLQSFLTRSKRRLSDLAFHDHLTGLYNRRSFDARLRDEVDRVRRYGRSFTLLIIDIDHFKKCNDQYGHQKGDEVLQGVARIVLSSIRRSDFAARYGGEELVVILPETPQEKGVRAAEKVRTAVEEHSRSYTEIDITVSVGGACCEQEHCDAARVVSSADEALYEAKQGGRNQIAFK